MVLVPMDGNHKLINNLDVYIAYFYKCLESEPKAWYTLT